MTPEEIEAETAAAALKAKHELVLGKIAPTMIDDLLDKFTKLQKPFAKLSEFQQKDFIDSVGRSVRVHLNEALPMLAQETNEARIGVSIAGFSVKGHDIKLALELTNTIPNLTMLGSVSPTSEVHLFIADTRKVDDFSQSVETKAQPDQPGMFEDDEPAPEPPSDDDLAEAGEAVAAEKEATE